MVDEMTRNQILYMFRAKDFEGMWFTCKSWYDNLGFKDATDQQRVEEYKWIVQQLRKYMFSKQDEVLACNTVDDMVTLVELYISRAEEYGDERKRIVYNFIRDHWLLELRNYLIQLESDMMVQGNIEDEEAEDEWAE